MYTYTIICLDVEIAAHYDYTYLFKLPLSFLTYLLKLYTANVHLPKTSWSIVGIHPTGKVRSLEASMYHKTMMYNILCTIQSPTTSNSLYRYR